VEVRALTKLLVIHDYPLPVYGTRTAGVLLMRTLEAVGFKEEDVYLTSVVAEKLDGDALGKLKAKDWKLETDRLVHLSNDADKVLFLGALPVAAYFGLDKSPKITKIRGRGMLDEDGHYCIATFAPRTCFSDADWFRDFAFDIQKLYTHDHPLPSPNVTVTRVNRDATADVAKTWLTDAISDTSLAEMWRADHLGGDIETTGLGLDSEILTIGISDEHGNSIIFEGPSEAARWYLEHYPGTLVFHNLKFDYKHLMQAFPGFNRHVSKFSDTMLASYLHDERGGKFKAHGLKELARKHFDAADYGIDMGKFLQEWKEEDIGADRKIDMFEELCTYQALDTTYTAMLYPLLIDQLEQESPKLVPLLEDVYVPAAIAFSNIERRGVPVNRPFFERKLEELNESIDAQLVELKETAYALTGRSEFRPGSPNELREVLYEDLGLPVRISKNDWKRKTDAPSTEKDILKALARDTRKDRPEVAQMIDTLLKWRTDAKMRATYVKGVLDRTDPDGRVRGEVRLHGTETGRVSMAKPNLQNVDPFVKEGFVAEPGWTLIEADFSQLELRVSAGYSADKTLVKTFDEDGDVHQEVAFALWGKPKEQVTKAERTLAKTVSFGSMYGLSAAGLAKSEVMTNLAESGQQVWSESQIRKFQAAFARKFVGLYAWIKKQKALGLKQKYVENLLGFRRRFPLVLPWDRSGIERQAVNTPIQGLAGQMTTIAVTMMDQQFNEEYAYVLLTVHDSILVMARDEVVDEVKERMRQIMEEDVPAFVLERGKPAAEVPFKVELETGRTWKECA
jgi:DNA polymerase I-like protein with 3'-5' exonuclease and polymerase domains